MAPGAGQILQASTDAGDRTVPDAGGTKGAFLRPHAGTGDPYAAIAALQRAADQRLGIVTG
jgi:glycine/D-amino acid oxidase-like deaminating enzyme